MDSLHILYDFNEKNSDIDQWDEISGSNGDLFHYLNMVHNFNITMRLLGPFLPARRLYLPMDVCNDYMTKSELRNVVIGNSDFIDRIRAKVDEDLKKENIKKGDKKKKNARSDRMDDIIDGIEELMASPSRTFAPNIFTDQRTLPLPTIPVTRRILPEYPEDSLELKGEHPATKLRSLKTFLDRCQDVRQWKPCMLVNALVISSHNEASVGKIKIFAITPNVMIKLQETCVDRFGSVKAKVNGLNAYDVILSSNRPNQNNRQRAMAANQMKMEFGSMLEDNVRLSEFPTLLPQNNIENIVKNGIFDIKKVIKEHNIKKLNSMFGYFFKAAESYKMPDEMMKSIIDEAKFIEERKQFDQIDELDRNSLPKEAFDDVEEITNPVMDMEI